MSMSFSSERVFPFRREVDEKSAAHDGARAEMEAQKAAVRKASGLAAGSAVGERPPRALLDKFREGQVIVRIYFENMVINIIL